MKTIKGKADVYQVRGNGTWGDIFVQWGKSSVQVTANTDFGVYGHYWPATGDPKQFLCSISIDYAMKKLSGYKAYVPDIDKYGEEIERMVIEARREGYLTRNEARQAWEEMPVICDEYVSAERICEELYNHKFFDKVFGDYEALPSPKKMDPQCVGFWENIWMPFIDELKKELGD